MSARCPKRREKKISIPNNYTRVNMVITAIVVQIQVIEVVNEEQP